MPTERKKKPSSNPSNGSTSACTSWRYSESDSRTPPRNAPSDVDSPAAWAREAVPATMNRARALNTSGVRAPPMTRKAGRIRNRPPTRMTAIAATASPTSSHGSRSGWLPPASSGTAATIGMKARSWNSSTEKVSRPERWPSRFRSASIGRTMAVEDSASPAPSTVAAAQVAPNQCAAAASTAAVTTTCAVPSPNTARRITQSRCGRTSSPMRNSNITMPSSETPAIASTSVTSRSPDGPISAPPTR